MQFNLLDNLKARISLTTLVTYNARWLLVSPIISLAAVLFSILAFLIDTTVFKGLKVVDPILQTGLLQIPILVIPLFVSTRVAVMKNCVAAASLRKLIDYLEHIPDGWMITHRKSINLSSLFSAAGLTTVFIAIVTLWVQTQKQVFTTPWDNRFEYFGSCYDGIRSGLEQHIDCGGPESSCPQTCREKYGDYIIIPATRECTDIEGYAHITTQRACSIAYKAWARMNNNNSDSVVANHAVIMEGVLEDDGISGFQTNDWFHADWTNGFRCGAVTKPGWSELTTTLQTSAFTTFPAVFSSWNPSFGTQEPLAYLCYAKRSRGQSCEALIYIKNGIHFDEEMACPGNIRHKWYGSAWRNISSTRASGDNSVVEFVAASSSDGDCAEIRMHGAVKGIGAHVVFTLECNVTKSVEASSGAKAGASSVNDQPVIMCPKDNRVQVSVESTTIPRATLLVYPAARGTSMTSYTLEATQQSAVVSAGSTLVLVADKSSNSMIVRLCF